jgi:hypothetical protein
MVIWKSASPPNRPTAPKSLTSGTSCISLPPAEAAPGAGYGDQCRPRRRAVLRRPSAAWVRGYLGRLLRVGAVLRPAQEPGLKPTPCSELPKHNMPVVTARCCLPPDHGGTGQRRGGRLSPPYAASRGGPTDRRTSDPRCGIRDGVSGHMARGCARAHRKRSPRHPCDPRRRLPPQLGRWRDRNAVRRCRASVRTFECSITTARKSTGAAAS